MSLSVRLSLLPVFGERVRGILWCWPGHSDASAFGLTGFGDIHQMNALKTTLGSCINGVSALIFMDCKINWELAIPMALAAIVGGYLGARYSQKVKKTYVRWFVITMGTRRIRLRTGRVL